MRAPRRSAPVAALALVLGAALSGCVVVPLPRRAWQSVETPHFEVFAAYDAELSARLGVELEQFRAAAEHLWGRPLPPPARRIRVIAYNGSGSVQPFRQPKREGSYLLARPVGETIVFRSPYGWSEAAPTELRLELARRLFRNAHDGNEAPWLVEGLAQLAATSDVRGGRQLRTSEILILPLLPLKMLEIAADTPDRVEVGQPRSDLVRRLRRDAWVPLERLTASHDLAGWSQRDREMFEAESWLLVHYLKFGVRDADTPSDLIEATRRTLDRGGDTEAALEAAAGKGLRHRLARYARGRTFDGLELGVEAVALAAPGPVGDNAIRGQLGELALDLESWELAQVYFEDALDREPAVGAYRAGLCAALAHQGSTDGSCERALAVGPDDPVVLGRVADAYRSLGLSAESSTLRRERTADAIDLYSDALARRQNDPALLYGLAAARFESGDAEGALEALARLHRWLPGDPEVQQLTARAELARGDREAARLWAGRAITTARNHAEISAAQSLLEQIDAQIARN